MPRKKYILHGDLFIGVMLHGAGGAGVFSRYPYPLSAHLRRKAAAALGG